jgi:AcrR family transcriptional regulator
MTADPDENAPLRSPALGRPVGSSGEQTRRRILEATVRCVGTMGYARATLREIAREAGMTSGPLYHYFPNKSELVRAAAEAVTQMASTRFVEATHRPGTAVDRLVALLEESDQLIREYPQVAAFDYAIRLESPRWLNLQEATATVYRTVLDLIVEIVTDAKSDGTLNADTDTEGASRAIFALIRGLTEMAATTPEADHHVTLSVARSLIRGTLFNTKKAKRQR